jgi:hypothetical protein
MDSVTLFRLQKPKTWRFLPLYEKIQYYKDQLNEEYVPYVDKIEAKRIVKEVLGDMIHVAPLVRILESPDDVSVDDICGNHLLKASHGCGWNIDLAEAEAGLTVESIRKSLHAWNKPYHAQYEPHYSWVPPRFFIEEKVCDKVHGRTAKAITYCIRCIHGKPFVVGVRDGDAQNNYDCNWNPVKPLEIEGLEKPAALGAMLHVAEVLSKPFEFVRIDLYLGEGDAIYFSEFTFTPSAGFMFYPLKYEKEFGKLWT